MVIDKEKILKAVEFKRILDELNEAWNDEQRRRHEFWAEVDEGVKAEFILGEIIYHSPIYGRHWMASTQLTRRLIPYVYDHKLGMVAYEKVMIRLTRNDFEPDVCFWRQEEVTDFDDKQSAFPAPNFIVEILSDSTKKRDYGIKKTDYALHGVEEYWIIDPVNETVEQYLLSGIAYELSQKLREGSLASEVITGFSIEVKDIFAKA
ncbi:Uma2 family endonuclease [Persicitalea sp.]|uniref:Uma2 family endonuclease n=1 Tax=Persicitalea sp. TaxID=3100273 RepID=UPI003593765A